MSDARYRKLALALPEAEEKSHFGKSDFRVRDKIFAGFNDKGMAYVKLTPEQQEMAVAAEPETVKPIPGGWGRKGWTLVDQTGADDVLLRSLLTMAYKNVAPKRLAGLI
jgi:predicted DNA-binding protein (MmcQ/YjbR family)